MNQMLHQILHLQLVQLRARHDAWLEGRDSGEFYPPGGICDGLDLGDADYDVLRDLMEAWPAGTGDRIFPVPHPTKTPVEGFYDCDAQEMWSPEFEYARNRLSLLDWLIEQTSAPN